MTGGELKNTEETKNDETVEITTSQESSDQSNLQQGTYNKANKDGSSTSQNQQVKIPATESDDRKLFVGGLPPDVTNEEFWVFFQQFGAIFDSVVMFDRETKNCRGFGFVTFVDPEVSKSLLTKGSHEDGIGRLNMRGKTCEVKRAEPKHPGLYPKGKQKLHGDSYPRYAYDGYMANSCLQPFHYSVPVYAIYMVPMFYHYPPATISDVAEFASPPLHPASYVNQVGDPYLTTQHPPASNAVYPQYQPPVMPMTPHETTAQPNAQLSAIHPVTPGLPTKLDEATLDKEGL